MKILSVFLLFFSVFSFAQEEIQSENDSINLNKFDLYWNKPKNQKIDLNVKIKSWDETKPEERERRRKRYEDLTYSQAITRDIIDGVVGGILNGIINGK